MQKIVCVHRLTFTESLICFYQNKRRDHLYGKPEQGDVDAGLEVETEDLTDGQNHNFRYTY